MMDEWGTLRRVLNVGGTLTIIGAVPVPDEVSMSVADMLGRNVVIDELQSLASAHIQTATGAEAGCVTACSASGMVISMAACLTGADMAAVERLPEVDRTRNEIVIQQGHLINAGGSPVDQLIRLTGAKVVPVGMANGTRPYHFAAALTDRTAAVLHVVAEAVKGDDLMPSQEVIALAHDRDIPVIVDAAAEPDPDRYVAEGADLVVFSGHKFLRGPTAGIVAGRKNLVEAAYLHQKHGIGRPMKVGKEGIAGSITALARFVKRNREAEEETVRERAESLVTELGGMDGVAPLAYLHRVPHRVWRVHLIIEPEKAGFTAADFSAALRNHDPAVFVRQAVDEPGRGRCVLDMTYLAPGADRELATIVRETAQRLGHRAA